MVKNCIIIDGKEIELSDETVREIKEKLSIEKDELQWVPEDDEEYYTISDTGYINLDIWSNEHFDRYRLKMGNIYKTKEIAQQKLDDMNEEIQQTFIKIENYVRNNDDRWRANWSDNGQLKYIICYDYCLKKWDRIDTRHMDFSQFYISEQMSDKVLKMLNGGEL